jgi:Na+-transporting NADH:ubiquinone oxidoreductase subunit NqrA
MVNQDCTHPSSERLIRNGNKLFFSMQEQQKCTVGKLFLSACLRAAVLAALAAAPGMVRADPLATSACLAVGTMTPEEIEAVRRSIIAGDGQGPVIVKQAGTRFQVCMAAAFAAETAKAVAAAAALAVAVSATPTQN